MDGAWMGPQERMGQGDGAALQGLSARRCPGREEQGGMWGHRRWLGAGTHCQAAHSTHGKARGPCGTRVARLPGRSLCRKKRRRKAMLSHLRCPAGCPKPTGHQNLPCPSCHATHRLPFGSSQPSRATIPLQTLGREKRGVAGGLLQPLPRAVPTWQSLGGPRVQAWPMRFVTSANSHCPTPLGTKEDPPGIQLGSLHPQCQPCALGSVPKRGWVDLHQHRSLLPVPPCAMGSSAVRLLSSWHPNPGHTSDHSSSLVPPTASPSSQSTSGMGDTGGSQEPPGSVSQGHWGGLVGGMWCQGGGGWTGHTGTLAHRRAATHRAPHRPTQTVGLL